MDSFDIFKKLTFGIDPKTLIDPFEKQKDEDRNAIYANLKITPPDKVKNPKQTEEEIAHVRRKCRIHVSGQDLPNPVLNFDAVMRLASFPAQFKDNVMSFGFSRLTPIQMQAVPTLLQNREMLACAPTGSGKTLSFLIPLLGKLCQKAQSKSISGIRVVILAPSRELANQLFIECERLCKDLPTRCLMLKKLEKMEPRMAKRGSKRYNVLVTTPNRLVYLINNSKCIDLSRTEWIVLDEADKLFEEGNRSFREQLGVIMQAASNSQLKRILFSATYAKSVQEWCKANMNNLAEITVGGRNTAALTVEQKLVYAGSEEGKLVGLRNLFVEGLLPPILIFVQTKERAADLFKELIYDGIMVGAIHSDLTQSQRDRVVEAFQNGKLWVLICTDLIGRGMDFRDVQVVINYDMPTSAVNYIHRIGRTGRAEKRGRAITFFTDSDIPNMRGIANVVRTAGFNVPEYLMQYRKPDRKTRQILARSAPKRRRISKIDWKARRRTIKRRVKRKQLREQKSKETPAT